MVIVAVSLLTSLSLRTAVKSSASRPCRFTPEERTLGIGGWVDHRADLKAMEEPKNFLYQESKACRPVRNPSPYRLYPFYLLLFSFPFIFSTSFSLFLPHLSILLSSLTYISFSSSSSSPHPIPLTTSFFSHLPIHYLPMSFFSSLLILTFTIFTSLFPCFLFSLLCPLLCLVHFVFHQCSDSCSCAARIRENSRNYLNYKVTGEHAVTVDIFVAACKTCALIRSAVLV